MISPITNVNLSHNRFDPVTSSKRSASENSGLQVPWESCLRSVVIKTSGMISRFRRVMIGSRYPRLLFTGLLAGCTVGCVDDHSLRDRRGAANGKPTRLGSLGRSDQATYVHNFGVVQLNCTYEHDFAITNTFAKPLTIASVDSFCACSAGKPDQAVISPGESTTIRVKYKTGPRARDELKRLKVRFQNSGVPPVVLEIRANVRRFVTVSPDRFLYERVSLNREVPDRHFDVENYGPSNLTNVSCSSNVPWVSLSVCEIPVQASTVPGRVRQKWRVVVTVDHSELGQTINRGRISLTALGDDGVIQREVPVALKLSQPVSTTPKEVFFGQIRPGEIVTRKVTVVFDDANTAVDPRDCAFLSNIDLPIEQDWEELSSGRWLLTLRARGLPHLANVKGDLKFTFRNRLNSEHTIESKLSVRAFCLPRVRVANHEVRAR